MLADPSLPILIGAVVLAGLVRGFSGFGAGMIAIPVMSRAIGPQAAVALFWIVDSLPSLPIVVPALRHFEGRTVLPVAIGYAATVGLGIWWLRVGDPELLRQAIGVFIVLSVVFLWSGWRYDGPRPYPLSTAVGALSGFAGGATQLSGPPVIIYWLSGSDRPARVRANIIVLFAATSILSGLGLWLSGVLSLAPLRTALILAPAYLVSLLIGQRVFRFADERHFRRVAFLVILSVAVATFPLFDG